MVSYLYIMRMLGGRKLGRDGHDYYRGEVGYVYLLRSTILEQYLCLLSVF